MGSQGTHPRRPLLGQLSVFGNDGQGGQDPSGGDCGGHGFQGIRIVSCLECFGGGCQEFGKSHSGNLMFDVAFLGRETV